MKNRTTECVDHSIVIVELQSLTQTTIKCHLMENDAAIIKGFGCNYLQRTVAQQDCTVERNGIQLEDIKTVCISLHTLQHL